jgi:hypothetical protein
MLVLEMENGDSGGRDATAAAAAGARTKLEGDRCVGALLPEVVYASEKAHKKCSIM